LEKVAESNIGTIDLTTSYMDNMFGYSNVFDLSTTRLNEYLPIFEKKLGQNRQMMFRFGFERPEVQFKSSNYNPLNL